MSSVFSHVPSRSGASSLRATHLISSCPWPKESHCNTILLSTQLTTPVKLSSNSTVFQLTSFRSFNSASSLAPADLGLKQDRQDGVEYSGKYSWCDFWDRLRHQSQLNQSFSANLRKKRGRNWDSAESNTRRPALDTESILAATDKPHQLTKKPTSSKTRPKSKHTQSQIPTPTQYLISTLRDPRHNHNNQERRNWTLDIPESEYNDVPLHTMASGQTKLLKKRPRLSLPTILADYIRLVEPLLDQTRGTDGGTHTALELDDALQKVFCEQNLRCLAARHYSPTDVVSWAWVLKSNTRYEAILRIFILESDQRVRNGPQIEGIPSFIPLLLLREQGLDTESFRLLLIYSLHLTTGQPLPKFDVATGLVSDESMLENIKSSGRAKPSLDPTMCFTFVTRLLRHAREIWPQAQLTIARAFACYLNLLRTEEKSSVVAAQRTNQFMAEKFNACLWLLSLPCKQGPFTSASIQQQAQFELLKAMAGHNPVFPVTRQGYQGIIAVQLAHKKTLAERQSADLKSASWPPWREEKLGIDSHRGIEGMKSRAMRVMTQMKEAGYSHTCWEEVSAILAGWDTDKSPTVQTRALMHRPQSLPEPSGSNPDHHAIWVARIRATRTVREAWACFLSYQDKGLPPRASIYAVMAEKLIFRKNAVERHFDQTSHALPGDGLEVFPEPSSARDLIYVHTEPPTLDELLKQMLSQGIRPSGRFLALLLRSAPSFSAGLDYLSCSDLSNGQIQELCTVWAKKSDYDVQGQKTLDKLPDYLFSSFIRFLCKFSNLDRLYLARHDVRTTDLFPIVIGDDQATHSRVSTLFDYAENAETSGSLQHPKTLSHAIQLVRLRKSRFPPAWIHTLSALSKDRISVPYRNMSRSVQRVLAWYEILEVTEWMKERAIEPGPQGFLVLCTSFSKAVTAGVKHPSAVEEGLHLVREAAQRGELAHLENIYPEFEDMVESGLHILKHHFDRLVLPGSGTSPFVERNISTLETATSSQVTVPPILHIPSPALLHAFVRSLGLAEDYDGLLNLLRWMSQWAATLKESSDEHLNGDRMMRRTLVAMRVFLEGYWGRRSSRSSTGTEHELNKFRFAPEFSSDHPQKLSFSDTNLQEAYDIITATPLWGTWPSDDEVWEYIHGEH